MATLLCLVLFCVPFQKSTIQSYQDDFFIENKHLLERENVPRCNSQFGGSIWTEEAVLIRASTEYH